LWAYRFAVDRSVFGNSFLSFCYSENTGAAWSTFKGHSFALALLGLAVMGMFIAWRNCFETFAKKFAWVLILGGIGGNTIDRFFRGYVIDFISINLKIYRWPTFNVADGAICLGIGILLFTFQKKEQKAC
jgi:signal peptidase II